MDMALKKKVLPLLLFAVVAVMLAGCAQKESQDQREESMTSATPIPEVKTPPSEYGSGVRGYLWYNLSFSPEPGNYLHSRDGKSLHDCVVGGRESKIVLVDSHVELGVVGVQVTGPPVCPIKVEEGDPCIVIKGEIRNEYSRGYTVGVYADVYNSTGAEVGHIIDPPVCRFTTTYAEANGTGNFSLHVKYDKLDISHYHLYAFTCNQPLP